MNLPATDTSGRNAAVALILSSSYEGDPFETFGQEPVPAPAIQSVKIVNDYLKYEQEMAVANELPTLKSVLAEKKSIE
jgi:hypothetical protein